MKRFATMTAIALVAGTTAFAQDSASAELNQEVYAMGMTELKDDGYNVTTVRQDASGNLTFMASNDTNGRILVMDDDGSILSDSMTQVNAGTMLETERASDDGDEASAMVAADTALEVETMSDDGDDSASISVGTGVNVGIDGSSDDGDGSASAGASTGIDLGISGSDDGDSASLSIGGSSGLGLSFGSES